MPTYIAVKAEDGWTQDDEMVYQTGYLVDAFPRSPLGPPGADISPPKFVEIEITDDDDFQQIKNTYCQFWRRDIDWEFVAHDYVIDGHRLRVFVRPELVSVSGLGGITRDQVESFLNRWNATVQSIGPNEVVFDSGVYDAIRSEGFWDYNVLMVGFSEISYTESTGIHRVEINYKNDPNLNEDKVVANVVERGGTVINTPTNKVVFEIERSTVFDNFKLDVKDRINNIFSRRRFKILQAHVDMALANAGTLSVTKQQFAQYVYDRLND